MKNFILIALVSLYVSNLYAICVHEKTLTGLELKKMVGQSGVFVETQKSIFKPLGQIELIEDKLYKVQQSHTQVFNKSHSVDDYNSRYIEYYDYPRMLKYLSLKKKELTQAGFDLRVIGKSIKGRKLFAITPKNLQNKKTIVMFGRHHGDEGTANWIIEGFFNEYLTNKKFQAEYQLILYPMVNPDGAQAHSRYNANGRDLNRSWSANMNNNYDEVKYIHEDLKSFMSKIGQNVFIALDMHGSFREDFMYRVRRNYVSIDFYNKQQNFIDELSIYDPWQAGNYKLSNGDPKMARLVLINHYKKNALTHETIRNIPRRNSRGRTKSSLIDQGMALIKSIQNIY